MRKFLFFLLLSTPVLLFSQGRDPRVEIVVMGGVATYAGDLGGDETKLMSDHLQKLGPALGVGARLHITNFLSLRGNFNYAVVSGADSLANKPDRQMRNLSFKSPIYEGSLLVEISIFNWKHIRSESALSSRSGRGNLYVYGGMAFFKFNPQAYYQDRWYDLQPFGTEGQGIKPSTPKYKLSSSALVGGLGYRYMLTERFSLGVEFGLRKTNTDYLDDASKEYFDNAAIASTYGPVAAALADRSYDDEGAPVLRPQGAQRASPKDKDYYGFAQITFAIKLGKVSGGYGYGGGKGRFRTRNRCYQF